MTTTVIGSNTMVRIGAVEQDENRLGLLAGHVLKNFKRMLEDGTLDVELSQAIAGRKGTIAAFSDDGEVSTVIPGKSCHFNKNML